MAEDRNLVARLALRDDWLAQVSEDIVDPAREIIDTHHHFWNYSGQLYGLDHLWADTGCGHNIVQTVYMECRTAYDHSAPDHLKYVGETKFVADLAKRAAGFPEKAQIGGLIAGADLSGPQLDDVLDAHHAAGAGLFRGIRQAGARDPYPDTLIIPGRGAQGQYASDAFRAGVARLGERGLTYDTWHYHHQNADFRDFAAAVPGTTIVLDHLGTPLGVGRFEGKRAEIFAAWKDDIAAIAQLPNVIAKLGGMAMPDNGWGWHDRAQPPGSDEFVDAQAPWFHHMIAAFGPERCMFESNFPVDRASVGYGVLWNALKKIADEYDEAAQAAMFSGTARQVYQL